MVCLSCIDGNELVTQGSSNHSFFQVQHHKINEQERKITRIFNKIWWQYQVATSTTRFASDVG